MAKVVQQLPRAVIEFPSLEVFKKLVDVALGDTVSGEHGGGAGGMVGLNNLKGLFQPEQFHESSFSSSVAATENSLTKFNPTTDEWQSKYILPRY